MVPRPATAPRPATVPKLGTAVRPATVPKRHMEARLPMATEEATVPKLAAVDMAVKAMGATAGNRMWQVTAIEQNFTPIQLVESR